MPQYTQKTKYVVADTYKVTPTPKEIKRVETDTYKVAPTPKVTSKPKKTKHVVADTRKVAPKPKKTKHVVADTHKVTPKPKKSRLKKLGKTCLALVLVLIIATPVYVWLKLDKMEYVTPQEISQGMGVSFDISRENYLGMSGANAMNITIPQGDIYTDKKVVNILLLGTDERSEEYSEARSDSMMILSINKRDNTWKVVSLERAMGVLIPNRQPDWLTHTFSYGGPELVLATVRNHLKLDIDKYVRVNFAVFEDVVDAMGGIEISITDKEAEYLIHTCGGSFGIGLQEFNGEFALQYARMRKIDNDWKRVERQRKVISAMVTKAKTLNPIELNNLANVALGGIQTNLTKAEMSSLILHAPFLINKEMEQLTVPVEDSFYTDYDNTGKSMYIVDFQRNADVLHELFYN